MKNLSTSIMFFLSVLLLTTNLVSQQERVVEKYSKVSIAIKDKAEIVAFQRMGFDMEGTKLNERSLEICLSEKEISILKVSGFSYEILIDDLSKYYQERNSRTETEMKNLEREMKEKYSNGGFGFGSMGGYYTYDEVVAELDSMRMLYPNLITEKDSIGITFEGRTIWAVKISDNPDINEVEPELFYNALIHAREPIGMMSAVYFMYYLLENYGSDPEITYLVDNREFYFVPIINPDGYKYNETTNPNGGGPWRKNRIDNGNGCFGVDLNRNFGYMWGYDDIGSSPDPCSELYRGISAFSELETQAVRDYCNAHNFIICNNYHAYWNIIFTPWGYVLEQSPDSTIFNYTIDLATQLNGYGNGWYDPEMYEVNGGVRDWMYGEETTKPKIFPYVTEVGNDDDGRWPIPERIFPLAEENVYLNKVLAWGPGVIDNPPHIFEADVYPGTYIPFTDSVTFNAKELNPDNYNSVVTAYVFDIDNNIVDEFILNKLDSNNYKTTLLVPQEENIYHMLLEDSGVEIPSNFYFSADSKFTTAGPVVIDSAVITPNPIPPNAYTVRLFVRNEGQSFTIEDLSITMSSDDSLIIFISSGSINVASLAPGEVVSPSTGFTVRVAPNFSLPFRFNFEIESDGWLYWKDTISIYQITAVEDKTTIPVSYKLIQNYPNPFNPSTKIKYLIPELSFVSLKVYDVLGNEIETLVNQERPAGTYELTWYASSLPSGVYFYQIRAGSFIETKKMMLLK